MSSFIRYLIEANIGLIIFLIVYWLLLKNENQFSLKRAYLLLALAASCLFPLITIDIPINNGVIAELEMAMTSHWLPEIVVGEKTSQPTPESNSLSIWNFIIIVYWTVVGVLALIFAIQLIRIIGIYYRSKKYKRNKHLICESDEPKPIFSFFNFIFIGQANKLTSQEKEEIIRHESIHASRFHSIDIILISALGVLFWFNPIIRLYKSLLSQLHEFEADVASVQSNHIDNYCMLLTKVALRSSGYSLVNHFSYSLTLKRIHMLKTMKRKIQPWKITAVAAVVPILFFVFACHQSENPEELRKDEVYKVVEEVAEPIGGMTNFLMSISRTIVYPNSARKDEVEGTVYISFIINQDGSVSDYKVLKSLRKDLDDEAIKVLKEANRAGWTPGKQNGVAVNLEYTIPFRFSLKDQGYAVIKVGDKQMETKKMSIVHLKKEKTGDRVKWTGTIIADDGSAIPGAHVILKGSNQGTTTDWKGNFELTTTPEGQLVASFVGFESVEIL
ncbi:hypothetical protein BH09BAC3_BH09BAC3_23410 [soil metagenome]